jgi:outer membrane protein OmpA-like peptidoglycan-associated protein
MNLTLTMCSAAILLYTLPAECQPAASQQGASPIYSVTVIDRTTKAINYQYRSGPTKIDFRGTVLLPQGKGEAVVESRQGRTEIDAKFENLESPDRFGRSYLTYVLWAITPEGAARNIGEVVAGSSNKARLHVTTDLQAFGLIVTAEPYGAARQPSDVVVLENEVRADTVGTVTAIQAKYELLPRGHYTLEMPASTAPPANGVRKVSMSQYEALLELYEAQNATGIARAANAEQYAPDTFAKAEGLLSEAQRLQGSKRPASLVVQKAREAAQTAEDARVIAERRRQDAQLAAANQEAARAREAQARAEASARQARIDADAARAQGNEEPSARDRAEAAGTTAEISERTAQAIAAAPPPPPPPQPQQEGTRKTELRTRLMEQMNAVMSTRDTPRGLVVTIGDSEFNGAELRESASAQLARLAAILAPNPGLKIDVEGYTDSAASEGLSSGRAEAVRRALAAQGLAGPRISARGLGDSRPVVSNSSASGREANRRVEIVISGDPIGSLAYWDRPYSLTVRR